MNRWDDELIKVSGFDKTAQTKQGANGLAGLISLRIFAEETLKIAGKVQTYCVKILGWKFYEDRVSIEGKTHLLWVDQKFDVKDNPSKEDLKDLEKRIKQRFGVKASVVGGREISVAIASKFPPHIDKD